MEGLTLVSCIIPSYKRADTLKRAIDSVLAQTYKNIEILVVDDNVSGDEYSIALKDMVLSYHNDKVKLITQERHINGAAARNAGVKSSSGDYIAFLDDDDEWFPDKVERQLRILQSNNEYAGIAGGAVEYRDGKEISHLPSKPITEDNLLFKVLIREVGLTTCSFLCKKCAFIEMGGFDPNLIRSQDLQLFADFLYKFRIYPIWDFKTVKVHVEDSNNRLCAEKLAANKEAYFCSIDKVMQSFPKKTQRRIKSAHYYEIAYVATKERNYSLALKYIFKGLASITSLKDLFVRYMSRK